MSDPFIEEKIEKAMDAARSGDRAAAKTLLEEVLEEDEENIRAWLLLGRLTTNVDEKRMAFSTVLQLDPTNAKAKALLQELEAKVGKAPGEEIIPGVSRETFRRIVIGVGGITALILFLVIFLVVSGNSKENSRNREGTAVVVELTRSIERITEAVIQGQRDATNAKSTQLALTTATPTQAPTSNAPTLPPTFTPEPTQSFDRPTALPPPESASGRMIGWSGRDLRNINALPIALYNVGGYAEPQILTEEDGHLPTISLDGTQMLFALFNATTDDFDIHFLDIEGSIGENLHLQITAERIEHLDEPRFSRDGTAIVFTAQALDTLTREIYLVRLTDVPEGESNVRRITADSANYASPSLSPDGSVIVAVRDDPASDNPGADIVLVDAQTGAPRALTSDRAQVVESNPRWSPDGGLIVFSAYTAADNRRGDIYIIASSGASSAFRIPELVDPSDDVFPIFSPSGEYIAFASNRSQSYNIFIFNLTSREFFQMTDTDSDNYPGDWIN
jgi:Tol biopolymer transport system component